MKYSSAVFDGRYHVKLAGKIWLDFEFVSKKQFPILYILMAVSNSFKVSSRLVCNSLFSLFWIDNEAHLHLSRNSVEQIAGMRDKLIHGYSGVDLGAVWDTAIKNTPSLKVKLQEILKGEGKEMNGVCNSSFRFGAFVLGRQGGDVACSRLPKFCKAKLHISPER